jgi:hypothetical protein
MTFSAGGAFHGRAKLLLQLFGPFQMAVADVVDLPNVLRLGV